MTTPCVRDAFWFGFYTGMRLREVLPLRWRRVDMAALVFRVEETKTGAPLELPIKGYAADWTIGQLRGPAQQIANRLEALMQGSATGAAPFSGSGPVAEAAQ